MRVEPATPDQLPMVRATYANARAIQREQGSSLWPDFSEAMIVAELTNGLLYRVLDDEMLVGIFSVAYEDPAIWGDRERGAHIYLHRIARAEDYAGRGLLDAVLAWARAQCRSMGRAGLRMDTWADNSALVGYYQRHGFNLLGTTHIGYDERLPGHYHGAELALLEEPL